MINKLVKWSHHLNSKGVPGANKNIFKDGNF